MLGYAALSDARIVKGVARLARAARRVRSPLVAVKRADDVGSATGNTIGSG
jgi:hypothetical protein